MHALPTPQPHPRLNQRTQATGPLLAVALAAAMIGSARADEQTPYYFGVSEALAHNSNVYLQTSTQGYVADDYSTTSLLAGLDQSYGRQHVFGTANVGYNKYRHNSDLNSTTYGLSANWDWATANKLGGGFSALANQSQASLASPLGKRESNLQQFEQFGANMQYGGEGLLTLLGNIGHSRVHFSAKDFLASNSSSDTGSLGFNYRVGPFTHLGLAARFTRTYEPYGVLPLGVPFGTIDPSYYQSDTANGKNLDFTLEWRPSDKSSVETRATWTRQTNSNANARDYSGLTGAIIGKFEPAAKLKGKVTISRDAGAYGLFFNRLGATPDTTLSGQSVNTQTTTSYGADLSYEVTSKVSVNLALLSALSNSVNPATQGGVPIPGPSYLGHDNTHTRSLGVKFQASRAWQLDCNYAYLSRAVSGGGLSYDDTTYTCSAQLTLR